MVLVQKGLAKRGPRLWRSKVIVRTHHFSPFLVVKKIYTFLAKTGPFQKQMFAQIERYSRAALLPGRIEQILLIICSRLERFLVS